VILPLLLALACGPLLPHGCIRWEIIPEVPYSETIPVLTDNLRQQGIPYEVTDANRVLIWTGIPYYLDPITESPEVREIRQRVLTCGPSKISRKAARKAMREQADRLRRGNDELRKIYANQKID
jgi:hypothetical protein